MIRTFAALVAACTFAAAPALGTTPPDSGTGAKAGHHHHKGAKGKHHKKHLHKHGASGSGSTQA